MLYFVIAVISFASGIFITDLIIEVRTLAIWLAVLALGVGLIRRRRSSASSAPTLTLIIFSLLLFALGLLRTDLFLANFNQDNLQFYLNQEVELIGQVSSEPDYREKMVMLYVRADETTILVSTDKYQDFHYGDEVKIVGKLEVPQSFTTDLGREFDYQKYLKIRKVEYTIPFAEVELLSSENGNQIISILLRGKIEFIESLQEIIPEPAVGLGNGLLLGVKSGLGEEVEENFRKTGIVHIVVLSGYNVMLVVTFIMFILSFLLPLRLRIVAGMLAIVAFALIVGLSATVARATIMAGLVLLALAYGRQYDVLRALFLAGLIMLMANPYLIYDVGFQLSFMATLGLILVVPMFETKIITDKRFFNWREFLLATIATQVAVFPLLLYHIGEISLIAVVVNLLVLPMVPVAMLLTFATGVLGFVSSTLAGVVGFIATGTLGYILWIADIFANLPFATVALPEFSWYWVFIMYGLMIVAYVYIQKPKITNEFSDWVIEEEKEKAGEQSPPAPEETPVFFR